MSGRITIDNLSDSLKEVIEQSGLTEEQVIQLIESNISGDLDLLNTTDKSSLVAAINELFQNANNGKELIASAIGEPLNSNDTFSAMSTDINGLLSTFKTNMMNSGVMVESSDKFKQLIDKIKGLTEGEGNKGIQFVEGIVDITHEATSSGSKGASIMHDIVADLPFTPTYAFITFNTAQRYVSGSGYINSSMEVVTLDNINYNVDNMFNHIFGKNGSTEYDFNSYINIIDGGLQLFLDISYVYDTKFNITYYAIGVGEEDTTLRDYLASILQEEGVTVIEEDDMASLISKVDEEFEEKRLSLLEALTVKNIPTNNNDSFDTLIGYISLFENYNLPSPNELNVYDSIGVIENGMGITFEKNTDHMLITIPQTSSDFSLLIGTNTKYDLTDYANIVVEYYSSIGRFALGINDSSQDFASCDHVEYYIGETNYNQLNTYKLNISDYNNEYYILFNVDAASAYGGSIKFYKIYLEK